VGHHPILSGSPYHGPTPELQDALYPLLVRGGVHAWLCGHEHDLQHLTDGRLEHILSGAGAECRPTGRTVQTCFARALPGFAVITLNPAVLRLAFYDAAGRRLYEADREPADFDGRRVSGA
jgi:acid phosphatase